MHSCHRFCGLQPLIIYQDPLYFLAPTPISSFVTLPPPPPKKPQNYPSTGLFVALFI